MINKLNFDDFLNTLQDTNRNLAFYVDWQKCLDKKDEISICLNHLNFLLGVAKTEMKAKITHLFNEYPKAFSCLNIFDNSCINFSVSAYSSYPSGIIFLSKILLTFL